MRKSSAFLNWLRHHRVAVTLNFVIHRRNIDHSKKCWLSRNPRARRGSIRQRPVLTAGLRQSENLLPTREQFKSFRRILKREQEKIAGKIRIEFVVRILREVPQALAWAAGAAS